MVLGVIIPQIIFPWSPIYQEVALRTSVAHPIKTHINCVCSALLDSGVDNSTLCGVVGKDRCGRLGVAHLREGEAEFFTLSCVGEEGSYFGFCCR